MIREDLRRFGMIREYFRIFEMIVENTIIYYDLLGGQVSRPISRRHHLEKLEKKWRNERLNIEFLEYIRWPMYIEA